MHSDEARCYKVVSYETEFGRVVYPSGVKVTIQNLNGCLDITQIPTQCHVSTVESRKTLCGTNVAQPRSFVKTVVKNKVITSKRDQTENPGIARLLSC